MTVGLTGIATAGTVLRLGSALAVLGKADGRERRDHDHTAMSLLRAATQRDDIVIDRRPSGRPRLAPPYPELSVSLSNRGGLLLVGFDPLRTVGVDIELADAADTSDPARLATDHFAPAESGAVRSAAAARDLFLRLWVAKEAALKITGRGVFDGLAAPDLSRHLEAVASGREIQLDAAEGLPAMSLIVARLPVDGVVEAPYCALAVMR